jgi:hypothetical protein
MERNRKVLNNEGFSGGKPHSKVLEDEPRRSESVPRAGAEDQDEQESAAGWRVCSFSRHSLGVSQEEVQKKPQMGTTQ